MAFGIERWPGMSLLFGGLGGIRRLLLMASVLCMLGGGALGAWRAIESTSSPAPEIVAGAADGAADRPEGLLRGFGGSDGGDAGGGPAMEEATGSGDPWSGWSPAIFRLGFSFFVGFAIATFMRAFVKTTTLVLGAVFLLLFLLQKSGVISVDWDLINGHYDSVAAWLSAQTASIQDFIQGALPSSASASAGAFAGFRKRR